MSRPRSLVPEWWRREACKWLLLIVVFGFVAGSGLSGAAQDMNQLILFRGIQGIFGGGLFSLVFSGMADLFTPVERGKWMGLFFSMFGVMLDTPLYAQAVLGDSPTTAGILLVPFMVTTMIGNAVVGRVLSKMRRNKPINLVGCALLPLGIIMLLFWGSAGSRLLLIGGLMVAGLGLSRWNPTSNLAVQNALPQDKIGVGTGLGTFVRTIGQTLGSAIIGAIVIGSYVTILPNRLPASAASLPATALAELTNPVRLVAREGDAAVSRSAQAGVDPQVASEVENAVHSSLAEGIHNGYLGALVISLLAGLVVLFGMPDHKLRGPEEWRRDRTVGSSAGTAVEAAAAH